MDNSVTFSEVVLFEEIPYEGVSFIYDDLPGLLNDIDGVAAYRPIRAEVRLFKRGEGIMAEGHIDATLKLRCDRCLNAYSHVISLSYSYILMPNSGDHLKDEVDLKDGDLDISFFNGVSIELSDIFREQIVLSLPVKRLCRKACKGLCPYCGKDLNTGRCMCKGYVKESPFKVLEAIRIQI